MIYTLKNCECKPFSCICVYYKCCIIVAARPPLRMHLCRVIVSCCLHIHLHHQYAAHSGYYVLIRRLYADLVLRRAREPTTRVVTMSRERGRARARRKTWTRLKLSYQFIGKVPVIAWRALATSELACVLRWDLGGAHSLTLYLLLSFLAPNTQHIKFVRGSTRRSSARMFYEARPTLHLRTIIFA